MGQMIDSDLTFSKMTSMQPLSRSSVSMLSSFTIPISFCILSSVSLFRMLRSLRYISCSHTAAESCPQMRKNQQK